MSAAAPAPPATIDHAWIRALPGDLPAAGYLVIHNPGDEPLELLRVTSPRFGDVMVHRSEHSGGMERMVTVDRLPIAAHGEAAFTPEGLHLMLMDAKRPLSVGEMVPLRFDFASGATLTAPFVVKGPAAAGP